MSLIDDNGEMVILVFCSNLWNDVRELLNRGHDNTLSICNGFRKIAGVLRPCDRVADLHELLDRIPNLLVENPAVGDYDNGIQHRTTVLFKPNQLMSKPSDRVGFAAACAVLNKILFSDTICFHIGKQLRYNIELMVAGEKLLFLFLFGVLVHLDNDLRVVFYNQRQFFLGENILPKIIGHKAVWIRRVTCSIIVSLVKWQKPAVLSGKFRAELDTGIVYGKMHHAAFEGKKRLARIAVIFVLLHSIVYILLCKLVFQLKGDNRQTVYKNAHIKGQLPGILCIAELTSHAENVLSKHLPCLGIVLGRR